MTHLKHVNKLYLIVYECWMPKRLSGVSGIVFIMLAPTKHTFELLDGHHNVYIMEILEVWTYHTHGCSMTVYIYAIHVPQVLSFGV